MTRISRSKVWVHCPERRDDEPRKEAGESRKEEAKQKEAKTRYAQTIGAEEVGGKMEPKETTLAKITEKIENMGLDSRMLVCEDRQEIHISIHCVMGLGASHKNVMNLIRQRGRRSHFLRRYTFFLYRAPKDPLRTYNVLVLRPFQTSWDKQPLRMNPAEELVA